MAARISEKAQGGRVLTSQIVRALVENTEELTFKGAVSFQLKGIKGVQPLYKVLWRRS